MHIPALSPNTIIIAVMLGATLYGALAGKQKLRTLILSVYVGLVLADQLAAIVVAQLHQSVELVTLGLFALPIILFGFTSGGAGKHEHKGAMIANLVVGLATGALIAASAVKLLPTSLAKDIATDSLIATLLLQYQLWLLGLLPLAALLFGMMKPKGSKH